MRCKDEKRIYSELIKKYNKALHRKAWIPKEIDRLNNCMNDDNKEKNYNQVMRLSEEIRNNETDIKKITSEIGKMENGNNSLKG